MDQNMDLGQSSFRTPRGDSRSASRESATDFPVPHLRGLGSGPLCVVWLIQLDIFLSLYQVQI